MITFDTVNLLQYTNSFKYNYFNRLYDLQNWIYNEIFKKSIDTRYRLQQLTHIESILLLTSIDGFIEIVKWIYYNRLCNNNALMWVGAINIVKWLNKNNISGYDKHTIYRAIRDNDLELVKYLTPIIGYGIDEIMWGAILSEKPDIVKWCMSFEIPLTPLMSDIINRYFN